ncbi:DUF4214 domain-containing protein [Nitrosomonas sp. sh817]|uniref:DUF4214 domain-containing protein n=1 Tax=Nitrosomonas sp. sh817 TaxID=3070658 RepID=UPI0027DDEB44|nr:DUF4214 domain-containing protein [Nitrosomonas sp. sh817]WMJ09137.1 DUF4214 domain-containing protein [Nitrosomonas sp. sh817]
MTVTNFNSGSLVNNTSVTSATYDGWTFGSGSSIDIANVNNSDMAVLLNQSGGRSILLNYSGASVTGFYFKSADGSDFKLNSFNFDNGPSGASTSLTVAGYRDGGLIVSAEAVNMTVNDSTGNISYTQLSNIGSIYSGTLSFNSAFANIDEIRFVFGSAVELTIDDIDISTAVVPPVITSATYDASTNSLVVTGTNMTATSGAANDIDVSKLTLTGQGGSTYTLTSSNVELDSATQFTVALNAADQLNVEGLLNKNGTSSVGGTTYNIAAAADWNPAQSGNADTTGNGITVSNVQTPTITSATYDASTGTLTVTGANLVKASGATNDIDASLLTFTGEGGSTYTLTDTSDVEITSSTSFALTLSSTDKAAVNQIINKNGTSSTGGTTFNLAAADDWNTIIGNTDISDTTGNGITVSNVAAPTITSATYDASTGALVVTGTGFLKLSGATNDIDVSKFTFTGEGGATYTLTDSTDVEITSGTAFTVTLSSTDKAEVNQIVNKNGTSSTGATTYNLAAAEDWAAGADSAAVVADTTGNGITVSSVAAPAITSATYDASTGALVVTGSGLLKASGAANDIDASRFTFTGEGGTTYTLTDSSDVEITSGTAFTITLSATDKAAVNQFINKNGTSSTSGTTYNLAAAEDWAAGADAAAVVADTTGNGITVSNVAAPAITSATYDYNSNVLTVTGTGFLQKSGATNDIDLSKLTFTGEGGATYTLTTATDVEITSGTSFSVTLTGADLINVETLLNKNGTSSAGSTTYNLAAAEDWAAGADSAAAVADTSGNGITVSNYAAPAITSATFDASTNVLTVSGTNFVANSGASNDVTVSLLTLTGEGGSYTLTSSSVDVTSATAFSVTLNADDQLAVRGLLNKNGTTSSSATTYNIAAAEDWMAGTAASIAVADLTGNGITVSNVQTPTITSATYDSDTGILVVTGSNLFKKTGASNDIDISTLTLTGGTASATYTITSASDVEITSSTSFSVTLSGADKTAADALLDQTGTASSGGSTYNLAAADNWLSAADAATDISDAVNAVTVSINPRITSATYDASSGSLAVTGTNLQANGSGADIDASKFTFTGEGGSTYTLTDSADVEISSSTAFTITLSATDKAAINQIANKNGTAATGGTTYNLAAADDWNTNATGGDTADATGNGITVSNVATPAITSATYDASTGALVVTGTGFLKLNGAANDIDASKFTFTGEDGATYTLTDSADVEITSGTAFTVTLSSTDKAAINQIVNKNGTASTGGTTYNLAAAEDWTAGASAAVAVADLTGNGITASSVAAPAITSAAYNTGTGALTVTGSGFLKASGAANDIDASAFTFTGEGGGTYTLTDTADVEITSGTTFTLTLSSTDKAAVNLLLNKAGTASTDATAYNLAAAEDWAAGADAAVTIADTGGNGITVSIPTSSSSGGGGGGSNNDGTATSTTTDGAATTTTTQADGTVVTVVSAVESSRQEDPDSLFRDYADIPLAADAAGNPLLTVSLPTGAGLNVTGRPAALGLAQAEASAITALAQIGGLSSNAASGLAAQARQFLAQLPGSDPVSVYTITPSVTGDQPPALPILIGSPAGAGATGNLLVIDARQLPPGTVIQLDNVAFASIVGAVRVTGGSGQNFAAGDDQNQFIVLGADDDTLSGGGGNDTIGSLGGDDRTSGDAGQDIVFGGAGNDQLNGGSGNDRLNGGFGFDRAIQDGQPADYRIAITGTQITLTNATGETDTLTDVELIEFSSGETIASAYSEAEAAAHHLAKTWLGRDLTAAEGNGIQNWTGVDTGGILAAFRSLPETIELGLQDKSGDELLAGLAGDPAIIRLDTVRDAGTGSANDEGYLPLGLALRADGGAGHDTLRMTGHRGDVHLEMAGDYLQLTRLSDGAMLDIRNAEAIAFNSGETTVIAHDPVEAILARLAHSFFGRDATAAEWQLGRETLQQPYDAEAILDWFQQRAGLRELTDTGFIQTIYNHTLGRAATDDELSMQLARLENNEIDRSWLTVEIAGSAEAATHLVGSVMQHDGWI